MYHDLYVQSDTLLLTDVFEAFRKTCVNIYELDPAYFVSLPGYAWTAMLKLTKAELELLTDKDMLLMFDAKHLYGWAMCKKLPIGGFKWVNIEEYTEEKIKKLQ